MSVELQRVADVVLRESGIRVRATQLPALERTLQRMQQGMTPAVLLEALEDAASGPELLERLIEAVTVKETYFLRSLNELELIDWPARLVAAMARGSTTLRVWNPACATGEEPYSLAILALEALGPHAPVQILATDIAPGALVLAEAGAYDTRSLRNVGGTARRRHFEGRGERLRVGAGPRRLVSFATHNLVRDPIPSTGHGPFDVIVCRNVLIYFDPKTAASTADAFTAALAPGGVLVLGAADMLAVMTGRSPAAPVPRREHGAGRQRQRLPSQRTPASEIHRPAMRRAARATPIRGDVASEARVILVVDDSVLVREVVRVGLPAPAWQVLSAESGSQALAVAARAQPDAVLLDVVMPGLDGPETFERLRAIALTRDIRVVFLTGCNEAVDRERLLALGADGLIAKPFKPTGLAGLLSAALGWPSCT